MESILSIFLKLKQFKWENKHAANMIQNCFYLQAPQCFPPYTVLVPDLTMQGSWKKVVFNDKKQLLCLFDLRKNLKDKNQKGMRKKTDFINAVFAELFQPISSQLW